MAIPKYQEILRPILQYLSDEKPRSVQEINDYLAKHFQLTEEEKNCLKPSGGQALFKNRYGWAKFHLKKSGLLKTLSNADTKITKQGLEFLQSHQSSFDRKTLMEISQFSKFIKKTVENQSYNRKT